MKITWIFPVVKREQGRGCGGGGGVEQKEEEVEDLVGRISNQIYLNKLVPFKPSLQYD